MKPSPTNDTRWHVQWSVRCACASPPLLPPAAEAGRQEPGLMITVGDRPVPQPPP